MNYYKLLDVMNLISKNNTKIQEVKVRSFKQSWGTDVEGFEYSGTIKLIGKQGYLNKVVGYVTNSTWLDELEECDKEHFEKYLNNLLI